jgi:hypothetical protein
VKRLNPYEVQGRILRSRKAKKEEPLEVASNGNPSQIITSAERQTTESRLLTALESRHLWRLSNL